VGDGEFGGGGVFLYWGGVVFGCGGGVHGGNLLFCVGVFNYSGDQYETSSPLYSLVCGSRYTSEICDTYHTGLTSGLICPKTIMRKSVVIF